MKGMVSTLNLLGLLLFGIVIWLSILLLIAIATTPLSMPWAIILGAIIIAFVVGAGRRK